MQISSQTNQVMSIIYANFTFFKWTPSSKMKYHGLWTRIGRNNDSDVNCKLMYRAVKGGFDCSEIV